MIHRIMESIIKDSMFSHGPILEKCGWYGEGEGMENILQGMLNVDDLASSYPEYGREGVEFLKALRYKKDGKGKEMEPFTWTFGVKEYFEVFCLWSIGLTHEPLEGSL